MLKKATGIKFKMTQVESGYFAPVDISGCRDKIPEKYFKKNVNYQPDGDAPVRQMQFPDNFEEVPLDFALCRYLAVEKGISFMPITNFCLHESKKPLHNFVRIAICRPPTNFDNPLMDGKFKNL